jgi:hypothetical protein
MYDLNTIQITIERVLGMTVSKSRLQDELEKPLFTPDLDRMIAVADDITHLPTTVKYGVFTGMVDGRYQIYSGRYRYARYLNPDELAKCF